MAADLDRAAAPTTLASTRKRSPPAATSRQLPTTPPRPAKRGVACADRNQVENLMRSKPDAEDVSLNEVFKNIVQTQIQTAEALKGINDVVSKLDPLAKRAGVASLKVNLTMPVLHDMDFDEVWKHWNACQNVARCQTAGAALDEVGFLSLLITTFAPEGGVRQLTVKTEYDRACRKGRLPDEAKEVSAEIRDAVALLGRSPISRRPGAWS